MARIGRPPAEHPLDQHPRFRVTTEEMAELRQAAERAEQPLGVWLRDKTLKAARRQR